MMYKPLISTIIKDDLCIACGACIEACPEGVIVPAYSKKRGCHEVKITNNKSCLDCNKYCEKVCPSIKVDFNYIFQNEAESYKDSKIYDGLGSISSIWTGYSKSMRDNGVTSSGGLIQVLIMEYISAGKSVICLARGESCNDYEVTNIDNIKRMNLIPGSIYHSVSFNNTISLLRSATSKVMLIAIPCQLEGIVNYITEVEPDLWDKIEFKVGIICGWMYSNHAINAFSVYKNIPEEGRGLVSYRGEDESGFLKISANNKVYRFHRRNFQSPLDAFDYRSAFGTPVNRMRCRLCQNHLNIFADIVFGDAWLKREKGSKLSILASRNVKGDSLISILKKAQDVTLTPASIEDLIESQSWSMASGQTGNIFKKVSKKKYPQYIPLRNTSNTTIKSNGKLNSYYHVNKMIYYQEIMLRNILRNGYYRTYKILYHIYSITKYLNQRINDYMRK